MLADGLKLHANSRNDKYGESLQKDITKLEEWDDKWHIRFNATKGKVIHIGKDNINYSDIMTQD